MPNPIFIPMEFAKNGIKNVIQKVRQSGQDAQDMTWNDGTPPITMTKLEDGGQPPKGQDFNGVVNALSSHTVFNQNGGRYKWDSRVISEFGGYPMDAIIQADDGSCEFKSIVSPNTINPNESLANSWVIYTGQGSVPLATSTTTGVMRVLNVLTSNDVGSALSAAMGRALNAAIDLKLNISNAFGIGQTWQNVSFSRSANANYLNNTGRPIELSITVLDNPNGSQPYIRMYVGDVMAVNLPDLAGGAAGYQQISATVPNNTSYRIDIGTNSIAYWAELR